MTPLPPPPGPSTGRRGPYAASLAAAVAVVLLVTAATVTASAVITRRVVAAQPTGTVGPAAGDALAPPTPTPSENASAPPAGPGTLTIDTDLPLQGPSADASAATNRLLQLYLDSIGSKAGTWKVRLRTFDDSTAARGAWDDATCAANAAKHVADKTVVAVIGTYNSGCSKLQVPVLNAAPGGPLLMVSHANTNPGLTKPWNPGEPASYYPTGRRSYARVVPTDDQQGVAAAQYVKAQGLRRVFVLDDGEVYGSGVADAFARTSRSLGVQVVGRAQWDAQASDYRALFRKAATARADTVYLGGIFDNNGGALVRDKVAVLGNNTKVRLVAPDGFTGYPELQKLPEAEGMNMTFAGEALDQLQQTGGPVLKDLVSAYESQYGPLPTTYALYAVAALQVVLQAVETSDGTRAGVLRAVLGGKGVTLPADRSAIGQEVSIDPRTGDVRAGKVTVLTMTGGVETYAESVPVRG